MDYIYYISIALALIYFFVREIKKEKERVRKRRQEKIELDISNLANAIVLDWNNSSKNSNKIYTEFGAVVYHFQNGNTVSYYNGKLIHDTDKFKRQYSLGDLDRIKIRSIFNQILEIINTRNRTRSKTSQKNNGSKSVNPKANRYDVLLETIELRREGLAKMSKDHPDRKALENELRVAENKAASIKNSK